MFPIAPLILSLSSLSFIHATAIPRRNPVTLSSSQIKEFKPYTLFASAAYCDPSKTKNWSCGPNCDANPGFEPVASGGDGAVTQFWFVGFDPALNTVIVSHEGTDPSRIRSIVTDSDFFLSSLDQQMFPGTSGLEVHTGFKDTHARAASDVLSAVRETLAAHSNASVTLVGHSLGAAIALIDAVYLPLHLPSSTRFKYVGYSSPRVGNTAFAQYLDSKFPDLTHVNNKEDIVPTLPGRFLGFQHPHGEIHIQDSGAWDVCDGDDNTSKLCSTGDVNIFHFNTNDHEGPFDGVTMGC